VPNVTSIINLKGGVGKTTLTLALAHFLAVEHEKRVLVIDLDPQTNATVCLIPEAEWKQRDEDGRTLYQLFADQFKGPPGSPLIARSSKGFPMLVAA
jgi:chromosome partitioning protein